MQRQSSSFGTLASKPCGTSPQAPYTLGASSSAGRRSTPMWSPSAAATTHTQRSTPLEAHELAYRPASSSHGKSSSLSRSTPLAARSSNILSGQRDSACSSVGARGSTTPVPISGSSCGPSTPHGLSASAGGLSTPPTAVSSSSSLRQQQDFLFELED